MMKYPNSNLLVVRAVMNTHRDSTFAQLKWAQEKLGVKGLWNCTVSPLEMTYMATGQKILFRGFDDVLKLASTTVPSGELCWVWIEEAFEIECEDDFEKLDLSVPRGKIETPLFKQTTLTFNPWSEKHWLKRRFFDKNDGSVGVYSTNYLCNEFLDSTDIDVFERMKKTAPARYRVAGLGEWGVSEGLVYENFSEGDEKISEADRWKWRSFFGLDYGYTNDPTAFIAFAANPVDKKIYVFDEFYETGMLNSDIAKRITDKGYAKERIRADSAEPKSNDDLRRLGIRRIMPSVKGRDSVINGIIGISEYSIKVSPKCKNTFLEFSSYVWEKDTFGNRNMPKDANNHLMDALRYAFYDVKQFKPINSEKRSATAIPQIGNNDFKGGWY